MSSVAVASPIGSCAAASYDRAAQVAAEEKKLDFLFPQTANWTKLIGSVDKTGMALDNRLLYKLILDSEQNRGADSLFKRFPGLGPLLNQPDHQMYFRRISRDRGADDIVYAGPILSPDVPAFIWWHRTSSGYRTIEITGTAQRLRADPPAQVLLSYSENGEADNYVILSNEGKVSNFKMAAPALSIPESAQPNHRSFKAPAGPICLSNEPIGMNSACSSGTLVRIRSLPSDSVTIARFTASTGVQWSLVQGEVVDKLDDDDLSMCSRDEPFPHHQPFGHRNSEPPDTPRLVCRIRMKPYLALNFVGWTDKLVFP